jgi:hypothetical protein
MVEIVETPEAKLKRHEDALAACMVEITRLREENARLRSSENSAHAVLREVYNDPTASPAVRVKAAGLALPHETPRLTPIAPAIDATAEEIIPLADLVRRRRAMADALRGLDWQDPANKAKFLAWSNRDHTDEPPDYMREGNDSAGNSGNDSSSD